MQENKLKDFTSFRLSKSTVFKQKYKKYLFERHLFSYLIVRQKTATSYQRNLKYILRLVIQTEIKCSFLHFCKIESIMPADLFGSLQKISHLMLLKIANIMFWSGSSSYLFSLLFFSCQKPIVPISIGKKTKKAKHQVFSNSALFAFLVCKKIICSPSSFSRIFLKSCVGIFSA